MLRVIGVNIRMSISIRFSNLSLLATGNFWTKLNGFLFSFIRFLNMAYSTLAERISKYLKYYISLFCFEIQLTVYKVLSIMHAKSINSMLFLISLFGVELTHKKDN